MAEVERNRSNEVNYQKRCFILGAGFSKCCGLPLASELTPLVWRSLAKSDPMGSEASSPRQPGDFGYEIVVKNQKAIRVLFPECECDYAKNESWPDFEQLLSALDEAVSFHDSIKQVRAYYSTQKWQPPKRTDGGTESPPDPNVNEDWAEHTKFWLLHHLREVISDRTDKAVQSGLELIQQFVQGVSRERDSIVTFNWDLLLEFVAEALKIPVFYKEGEETGLQLAKPHGSLNLVDVTKAEFESSRGSINVDDKTLRKEITYTTEEERVLLRAPPERTMEQLIWARPGSLLMVEPNTRKSYDRPWLVLQWDRALKMVRQADEIIVIGYSLPETDLRPRLLLQLAGLGRNNKPMPKLVLVDPNANDLAEHYSRLTGLDPEPHAQKLEDWLA